MEDKYSKKSTALLSLLAQIESKSVKGLQYALRR